MDYEKQPSQGICNMITVLTSNKLYYAFFFVKKYFQVYKLVDENYLIASTLITLRKKLFEPFKTTHK